MQIATCCLRQASPESNSDLAKAWSCHQMERKPNYRRELIFFSFSPKAWRFQKSQVSENLKFNFSVENSKTDFCFARKEHNIWRLAFAPTRLFRKRWFLKIPKNDLLERASVILLLKRSLKNNIRIVIDLFSVRLRVAWKELLIRRIVFSWVESTFGEY